MKYLILLIPIVLFGLFALSTAGGIEAQKISLQFDKDGFSAIKSIEVPGTTSYLKRKAGTPATVFGAHFSFTDQDAIPPTWFRQVWSRGQRGLSDVRHIDVVEFKDTIFDVATESGDVRVQAQGILKRTPDNVFKAAFDITAAQYQLIFDATLDGVVIPGTGFSGMFKFENGTLRFDNFQFNRTSGEARIVVSPRFDQWRIEPNFRAGSVVWRDFSVLGATVTGIYGNDRLNITAAGQPGGLDNAEASLIYAQDRPPALHITGASLSDVNQWLTMLFCLPEKTFKDKLESDEIHPVNVSFNDEENYYALRFERTTNPFELRIPNEAKTNCNKD